VHFRSFGLVSDATLDSPPRGTCFKTVLEKVKGPCVSPVLPIAVCRGSWVLPSFSNAWFSPASSQGPPSFSTLSNGGTSTSFFFSSRSCLFCPSLATCSLVLPVFAFFLVCLLIFEYPLCGRDTLCSLADSHLLKCPLLPFWLDL